MNDLVAPGTRHECFTVIGLDQTNPRSRHQWLCRCDCGNERTFTRSKLMLQPWLDCGCGVSPKRRRKRRSFVQPKFPNLTVKPVCITTIIFKGRSPALFPVRFSDYGGRDGSP